MYSVSLSDILAQISPVVKENLKIDEYHHNDFFSSRMDANFEQQKTSCNRMRQVVLIDSRLFL